MLQSYLRFLSSKCSLEFDQPGVGHVQLGDGIYNWGGQSGEILKTGIIHSFLQVTRSLEISSAGANHKDILKLTTSIDYLVTIYILFFIFCLSDSSSFSLPVASLSLHDKSRVTGMLH